MEYRIINTIIGQKKISNTYYTLAGNYLHALLTPFLWVYGKTTRPRVRLLLISEGRVLLVRNWFGTRHWTLPGGGVMRRETEREALQREVQEELGMIISQSALKHVGVFLAADTLAPFRISTYVSTDTVATAQLLKADTKEIIAAQWFRLDALPEHISSEFLFSYARYNGTTKK